MTKPPRSRTLKTPRLRLERWTRKNIEIDQRKLDRARTILGVKTETDTVDTALDMVVFRGEVLSGIDRLVRAGGLEPTLRKR